MMTAVWVKFWIAAMMHGEIKKKGSIFKIKGFKE